MCKEDAVPNLTHTAETGKVTSGHGVPTLSFSGCGSRRRSEPSSLQTCLFSRTQTLVHGSYTNIKLVLLVHNDQLESHLRTRLNICNLSAGMYVPVLIDVQLHLPALRGI